MHNTYKHTQISINLYVALECRMWQNSHIYIHTHKLTHTHTHTHAYIHTQISINLYVALECRMWQNSLRERTKSLKSLIYDSKRKLEFLRKFTGKKPQYMCICTCIWRHTCIHTYMVQVKGLNICGFVHAYEDIHTYMKSLIYGNS